MTNRYKEPEDSTLTIPIQLDSSWPEFAKKSDTRYLLSYLNERFGIPEDFFDDYQIFKRKKSWWILKRSLHIVPACSLKAQRVGLRAFSEVGNFVKPSTRFIQAFGHKAKKAIIKINTEDLQELLSDKFLDTSLNIENGYVLLSLDGCVLGLGLLINGAVRSQLSKKELKFILPSSLNN